MKSPAYTLPVIHDLSRDVVLSDSNRIAAYLEDTFPQTRPLDVGESIDFAESFGARLNEALFPLTAAPTAENLLPETRAAWRAKRERAYGMRLEDMAEPQEKREELLAAVLGVLTDIDACGGDGGGKGDGPFIKGDKLTYRDVVIAATLTNTRRLLGAQSDVWKLVVDAHGGRWKRLMDRFDEWEVVGVEECASEA